MSSMADGAIARRERQGRFILDGDLPLLPLSRLRERVDEPSEARVGRERARLLRHSRVGSVRIEGRMKTPSANTLYYGDNLDILRKYVADESVDLVYLDPPFNSNANYNVLFKAPGGEGSQSQIEAFEDSWHWNTTAERAFDEVINSDNSDGGHLDSLGTQQAHELGAREEHNSRADC
jgi:hypothetical protein